MENIANLRKLQLVELDILNEVDRVCKETNIKYMLSSGTLLGAIRHKGFIPWDNDIDIMMHIDDYRKFCKIANNHLKDEYFLQCYNTDYYASHFAKVRKSGTTMIEKGYEKSKIHQGVWIDIFPIIGVKDDVKWLKKLNKRISFVNKLLKAKFSSMTNFDNSSKRNIMKIVPLKLLRKIADFVYGSQFKDCRDFERCTYLLGSNVRPRFFSEWFSEIEEVSFEGKQFPINNGWDSYLKKLYKDYMVLPPIEERGNGSDHTISIIDLDKDYTEYVRS